MDATKPEYEGIRGWLLLSAIGMALSPFRVARMIHRDLLPVFHNGTYELLIEEGSEFYHPLWKPLLMFEVVGNAILFIFPIIALFFVVRRSRNAPRVAIAWLTTSLIFVNADYFLAGQIPLIAEQPTDIESLRQVVLTYVAAAIWIPYYLVSKRVKATLIR